MLTVAKRKPDHQAKLESGQSINVMTATYLRYMRKIQFYDTGQVTEKRKHRLCRTERAGEGLTHRGALFKEAHFTGSPRGQDIRQINVSGPVIRKKGNGKEVSSVISRFVTFP